MKLLSKLNIQTILLLLIMAIPIILHFSSTPKKQCTRVFTRYESSQWESEWLANINEWSSSDQTCIKLYEHKDKLEFYLKYSVAWQMGDTGMLKQLECDPLFEITISKFWYRDECMGMGMGMGGNKEYYWEPIEPLIGSLRDQSAFPENCPDFNFDFPSVPSGLDKTRRYMIPSSSSSLPQAGYPRTGSNGKVGLILLDFGASLWSSGLAGPSQRWFWDLYTRQGFEFKRMLLWEAENHRPSDLFKEVPDELIPVFSYYNVPVSADSQAQMYPWRFLKHLAGLDGDGCFMVVKLDIDTEEIEVPLIMELMENPDLANLVDELYFEYHNNDISSMKPRVKTTLPQVYETALKFRQLGVRYHHYP